MNRGSRGLVGRRFVQLLIEPCLVNGVAEDRTLTYASIERDVPDESHGYERVAEEFMRTRRPSIGPAVVRRWAGALPAGASILDLGCGSGIPISEALLEEGFSLYGVDASETLIARFRERFPGVPAECGPVEESLFFSRLFDGVVAWGLMFLLPADTQPA